MRLFLLCFVCHISSLIAIDTIPLDYVFKLDNQRLLVELTFQTEGNSVTEIEIPSFIDFDSDIVQSIDNIQCFIDEKEHKHEIEDQIIQISHIPYDRITIEYSLILKDEFFNGPQVLYFFGDRFFLIPKTTPDSNVEVSIEWEDFPLDWKAISSFGIGKKQEFTGSVFQFSQSFFSIGNLNITSVENNGNNLYIATPYEQSNSLSRLENIMEKIVYEQGKFWQDFDFPYFFMLHLPNQKENDLYGEAKLNAFLVSSKDINLVSEQDWVDLSWVISHEHFHTWLPGKMFPSLLQNFDDLAWFTEGFTEYYAMVTAYRADILSIEQVIDEVNNFLFTYHSSKMKNKTNDYIVENRYLEYETHKLPYQRGFLLALLWDEKIKNRTFNQNSLDDVMYDLIQKLKDESFSLSPLDFAEIVKEYIGEDAVSDLQDYILKGKTLPTPLRVLERNCIVEWVSNKDNEELVPQLRLI